MAKKRVFIIIGAVFVFLILIGIIAGGGGKESKPTSVQEAFNQGQGGQNGDQNGDGALIDC